MTLAILPAIIGLGGLLWKRGWQRSFLMGLCALSIGGVVWLLILVTYYHTYYLLPRFFRELSIFIGSAHPTQSYWDWLQIALT